MAGDTMTRRTRRPPVDPSSIDPALVRAAAEVDRSLLRDALARSPLERLRAASRACAALARYTRHGPPER
jgi:phage gp36-like protein